MADVCNLCDESPRIPSLEGKRGLSRMALSGRGLSRLAAQKCSGRCGGCAALTPPDEAHKGRYDAILYLAAGIG